MDKTQPLTKARPAHSDMEQDDARLLEEARTRLHNIYDVEQPTREQCLEDRRFYQVAGAMWEDEYGDQFENKAKLEVNRLLIAIRKIEAEARNNPITCDFVSTDGKGSEKLADVCDGLYRADEQDSGGRLAYNNMFHEGIGGGFGAFRLTTRWEDEFDEDDDRLRIHFETIDDADNRVFFDPAAKEQDKSDAMYAFILTHVPLDEYMEEYDDNPVSWNKIYSRSNYYDWYRRRTNTVTIMEYFRIEETYKKYYFYEDLFGEPMKVSEDKYTEEYHAEMTAKGYKLVSEKNAKVRHVVKHVLSGGKVLERDIVIPGTEIPIVPFYASRAIVNGVERIQGHVRIAKDVQRLLNMQLSRLADISAKSPTSTPILLDEQIAGHEVAWDNAAIDDPAYLTVNSITDAQGNVIPSGPIGQVQAPDIPPALAASMQFANGVVETILGDTRGGEQLRSNISQEVVESISERLDLFNYVYMDNKAIAIARSGQIWLSMAKEIYSDDGRMMRTVSPDGKSSSIELGRAILDKDDGSVTSDSDLSLASFNVFTKVGPASASRRAATVRNLTKLTQVINVPAIQQVLALAILQNMEGEGMSEINVYARKQMIEQGIIEPTPEEAQKIAEEQAGQQQGPTPEEQYLAAEAEKNMADAEKKKAEVGKVEAQTREIDAALEGVAPI